MSNWARLKVLIVAHLALFIFVIGSSAKASPSVNSQDAQIAAKAIAAYLNSFATYGELLAHVERFVGTEQKKELVAQFRRLNTELNEKLPNYMVEKSTLKILGSDEKIEVENNLAFSIRGRIYRFANEKSLSTTIKELTDELLNKRATFYFPALIDRAEADFGKKITAASAALVAAAIASSAVAAAYNYIAAELAFGGGRTYRYAYRHTRCSHMDRKRSI